MVLVANAGLRTPSGALAHYLTAYTPESLARSDYLRPPLSPARIQPRSSLSLRVDSVDEERLKYRVVHTSSVHLLKRQGRVRSPVSPPCDCLPIDPIPPPELFDF
ncbi:jg1400 [Pararge aegeria aegeria]|uniref:Jg1400 protein n=2 Tax=Pararge aegeria TaxID=116150 RepID=A0A8S4RHB8_9NEOP|nr:jg1400 [Pararge aegeria aegeria]